ncbi:MAG: cobaltochelatase subunit CobN, partial [Cyanobacteria bacterium P01_F01_bin.42]
LALALPRLPEDFPEVRVVNLLHLQQQLTIDTYCEAVLDQAQVIILRLLGGKAYWPYGLEVIQESVRQTGAALWVIPGDGHPDPRLMDCSTVSWQTLNRFWRYWIEGGVENIGESLKYSAHISLGAALEVAPPQLIPRVGCWMAELTSSVQTADRIGILFYRAHYLAGNTGPIKALEAALAALGIEAIAVYVQSLQDPEVQSQLREMLQEANVGVLINTTSFSLAKLSSETLNLSLWQRLNVPIIQAICSGGTRDQWTQNPQGLSPRDMAMNVALPEVDGRIISRAISFKTVERFAAGLETDVVRYQPQGDRVQFVAELAANCLKLRQTARDSRRVALVMANYPNRNGRLANGVGLDTPASCIKILEALRDDGYAVAELPESSEALINRLTAGVTNDPEGIDWRPVAQALSLETYEQYFSALPPDVQAKICDRWGPPSNAAKNGRFPISGFQSGHIFVGIQASRGYDLDPSLNYHSPDLEPPHAYLAFYFWLRHQFGAQAVVHVGKHGNLEWLPGKSIALSQSCFPEAVLGPLPHFYPFIVNDPGEGAQAKRRSQAVIVDHLTPPLTRAELYGPLQRLEALIDEYYEAQSLNPGRLETIRDRIVALVEAEKLHRDLGMAELAARSRDQIDEFLTQADGYLCDLKEAQIRDGLHILGQCPDGEQLRDLILSIARSPSQGRLGLTQAIAEDWGLGLDPRACDVTMALTDSQRDAIRRRLSQVELAAGALRNGGDAIAAIEDYAAYLVDRLLIDSDAESLSTPDRIDQVQDLEQEESESQAILRWISGRLLPNLRQTTDELANLLTGLDGAYVPSGASGAPTRGRPDVLPTGRNFYSVDIRSLPTESAWDVGRRAAETVIERYCQEEGDYPKRLGLSMWGTATMRTGGDDMAEAMALLGVRPVWDGPSRRVIDFEIIPLSVLGRPRVDVTLRISGFFRDAFANLINLFDQAVVAVSRLDEPESQNPLAAQCRQESEQWVEVGLSLEQAQRRSQFRIFGSKPGAYGAGLQGLIESQNWESDRDLARAYLNWSSYAYTGQAESHTAMEAFTQRLAQLEIVLQNQDNREHDLLDSDDYYQFQGGLTAAVRSIQGKNPAAYFGDHSRPERPQVRKLSEEIARVYRSRVVNPKWIKGAMRHGYKGAFEMAATLDYLFAYDASAQCVEDFMYEGVANAYVLNQTVQDFVREKNPWALRDMAERLLEAHQRGLWTDV